MKRPESRNDAVVMVRLPSETIAVIDRWRAAQVALPTRAASIRWILEMFARENNGKAKTIRVVSK